MECPIIKSDFLSKQEQELLIRCSKEINPDGEVIHVNELGRVGKTGARLLLIYFEDDEGSLPFVIKINKKEEIETEWEAVETIKVYFRDAVQFLKPHYTETYGAIMYLHVGGSTSIDIKKSKEFKEIAFDLNYETENVVQHLTELYAKLFAPAHKRVEVRNVKLLDEYDWYLRNNDCIPRIVSIFGKESKEESFNFLGAKIYNPLFIIENKYFYNAKECMIAPIHGDLHPNNFIIDAKNDPHLIDFAWSKKRGHYLKDFVLMENSLRFMLFPKHVNMKEQLIIDSCLLDEDINNALAKVKKFNSLEKTYIRLLEMIKVIRVQARLVNTKQYKFEDYLAAQFLILYGLLKYDEYNHIALRALGLISKYLKDNGVC